MKKRTLKSLSLNKKSISNLSSGEVLGQGPITINRDCNVRFTFDALCRHFTRNNNCYRPSQDNCQITTTTILTGDAC